MTTTLAQLKTKVLHKLGTDTNDGMADNLTESINAGLTQMATEFDWPWLVRSTTVPTVTDTQAVSLPANATRVRTISIGSAQLRNVQEDEIIRQTDRGNASPWCYYIENNSILLSPTPNGVYSLRISYVIAENVLDDDADTPLCPDWYIDLVVVYGAIEEARRMRDQVLVGMLEQSKTAWINRIRDNVQKNKDLQEIVTRDDW